MARRSARLQKRSPTPSDSSTASWETAQTARSPQTEPLPSLDEGTEPASSTKLQTPQNRHVEKAQPTSQLPQPSNIATPLKNKSSKSSLNTVTAWTPKSNALMKPAGEEMHPALHHASTAKKLDEARWLGFQALGALTAPAKKSDSLAVANATPSKTVVRTSTSKVPLNDVATPRSKFKFSFRSPLSGLSPKTSRILKGTPANDNVTDDRALFGANEFSSPADVAPRKMAVPKGKSARFSDVHMAQFKKMDSIANHPSAFRADPSRFKPVNQSLKRSPSKAELDGPEQTSRVPNKLKRTQSKMDVAEPNTKTPLVSKLIATPLKRTQSKVDVTVSSSSLPRSQNSVRLVPPSRDGRPTTQDGGGPSTKRLKRLETDDAGSTRPISRDGRTDAENVAGNSRQLHSQIALPRPISRLMTPTRSSLARSQSAKALKSRSMIPSLLRSPSTKTLFSPTDVTAAMKEGVREGIRKTSNTLSIVRSILRTPNRKFSDDPEKVAAGTHMSPPPGLDLGKVLPKVPATAPVRKHVNFTNSTLEKAAQDELGKSPSPSKFRGPAPSGAVLYPSLHTGIEYPALPEEDESPIGSPSRPLTFGGTPNNAPVQFSFQSDKPINFGLASTSTIRMVRKSDASSLVEAKKRKLDLFEETSDKENNGHADGEGRSPKKMKSSEAPHTPSASSKLPRRTPKRGSAISKSRLAYLATPKRSKA